MEFAKRITSVRSVLMIKPALCASGPFTVWAKTTMMNDNNDNKLLPSTLRLRVNFP